MSPSPCAKSLGTLLFTTFKVARPAILVSRALCPSSRSNMCYMYLNFSLSRAWAAFLLAFRRVSHSGTCPQRNGRPEACCHGWLYLLYSGVSVGIRRFILKRPRPIEGDRYGWRNLSYDFVSTHVLPAASNPGHASGRRPGKLHHR